ncbi:MAG: hypothetical protein PHQ18_02120 [Patescibacteria group bacterium]|nr:hypothetical protein [Patescibacteria group bacterium]
MSREHVGFDEKMGIKATTKEILRSIEFNDEYDKKTKKEKGCLGPLSDNELFYIDGPKLGSLYSRMEIYYNYIFQNNINNKENRVFSLFLNTIQDFRHFERDILELLTELSKLDITSEEFKSKNYIRKQILEKVEEILECILEKPYSASDEISGTVIKNFAAESLAKINDFIFEL